jgi:hypothetical protein
MKYTFPTVEVVTPDRHASLLHKFVFQVLALGFARLIGSDHNNSVRILQEINESSIMAPRQEGLLEETEEESIRVSHTRIALDMELF